MRSVQIAELKNKLSSYLTFVRAGEEIMVRDRKVAIARIVPLSLEKIDEDEESLVAEGLMMLPSKPFDADAFFAAGKAAKGPRVSTAALERAMSFAREDVNVSILGRKRRRSPVRSGAKK